MPELAARVYDASVSKTDSEFAEEGGLQLSLLPDLPASAQVPTRLQKPAAVIHMYPLEGTYNLYCRKVYNALLVLTLRAWASIDTETRALILEQRRVLRFVATTQDVMRIMRSTSKDSKRIIQTIELLEGIKCRYDVTDETGGQWRMRSRLLGTWGEEADAPGVRWEYPPDIFEMLMRPMPYAIIDLRLANSLTSLYALALYENTNRYVGSPSKLTRRLPVEDWIRLLVTTNAVGRYLKPGNYRYFKREVVMRAMAELEASDACPITLSMIETTSGRGRVTHLQFRVELKQQYPLPTETGQTGNPRLEEKMRKWGVSNAVINSLIISREETEIAYYVARMEKLLAAGKTFKKSVAAAFVDSINRQYDSELLTAQRVEREQIKQNQVALREQISEEAFTTFIRERVKAFYMRQVPMVQTQLCDRYFQSDLANSIEREAYAKHGLESAMAAGPFYAWLGQQEGVLVAPEEQSRQAYEQWCESQKKKAPGEAEAGDAS